MGFETNELREKAKQKIKFWEDAINDYRASIERYRVAQPDAAGNIRNESGDAIFKAEGIKGIEGLIAEAEAEKAKEEARARL